MQIKTLFSVKRMNRKIRAAVFKHKRLAEALTQTVFTSDGTPRSCAVKNKIETLTAEKVDTEKKLLRLESVESSIRKKLELIFEKHFAAFEQYFFEWQTLIYKYCYLYSYRQIAECLCYSLSSVYRFHRSALAFLGFNESQIHIIESGHLREKG